MFKILASYCNSKLTSAIVTARRCDCCVITECRIKQDHSQPAGDVGEGRAVAPRWTAFLLLSSLISLYLPLSVSGELLSVPCPVHELLLNPSTPHFCLSVGDTQMSPVLITSETARKIPWPEGWLATLGDLGGFYLARLQELALCAVSWWPWSQGGQ